jgi:hypothetical protein
VTLIIRFFHAGLSIGPITSHCSAYSAAIQFHLRNCPVPLASIKLTPIVTRHLPQIEQTGSSRKRKTVLQFMAKALTCAQAQVHRCRTELDRCVEELTAAFQRLTGKKCQQGIQEVAILLERLARLSPTPQRFAPFFAALNLEQVRFSSFMSPFAAKNRESISEAVFRAALKFKLPSQRGNWLKARYILASETVEVGFGKIGEELLAQIARQFAACPICGQLALCLFGRLIMTLKSDEIDQTVISIFGCFSFNKSPNFRHRALPFRSPFPLHSISFTRSPSP